MSFSIESKLGDLLDNETTKAILEKHLPGISTHPQIGQVLRWPDHRRPAAKGQRRTGHTVMPAGLAALLMPT